MTTLSRLVVAGAVLGLAGCSLGDSFRVEPFIAKGIKGGEFNTYLAQEYQRRTKVEAFTDEEWTHAGKYFVKKGEAALAGQTVQPEDPGQWNIDPADKPDLDAARARLVAALDGGGRERAPKECAKAQVYYDGWLEQAHDNDYGAITDKKTDKTRLLYGPVQPNYVDAERANFEKWIPLCEGVQAAQEFIIYFEYDKASITDAAGAVLDEVVREASGKPVSVVGHTDTSGSSEYNVNLSERRAQNTAGALKDRGASVGSVGFEGEARPAVESGDGVKEPLNRRAVLSIAR